MIRLCAALLALIFLAGCGSDGGDDGDGGDGGEAVVELEGRSFVGTPVTGRELAPDSELTVSFEEGRVALNAGCNNMAGPYEVNDGRLELTGPIISTMMACPEPLQRQDEWLTEFFSGGPEVVALEDGTVSLRGEAIEIELRPAG